MHTSARGLQLIEGFEGFSASRYDDGTGVLTIGYGTTSADGPLPWHLSQPEAEVLLRRKLAEKYEPSVNALHLPLSQAQFDALVSFAYNLGPGIFTGGLRDALLRRDWRAAANIMLAYDHAGGVVLAGLSRRRREEAALFLSDTQPARPANPLDVLLPAERRLANTIIAYRKHPQLHRHGIAVTLAALVVKRKAVWYAACEGHRQPTPEGWRRLNRGRRYRMLKALTG